MPARRRKTLLLDLDGTLVDPAEGIIGSCRYAMARMGHPIAEDENLSWIIGPSLRTTFARLLGERGDPEVAVRLYRERYSNWGLTAAAPYPGVREVLAARRAGGAPLFLCTAKPAVFAKRVVDFFGFADLLNGVYGPELDGKYDDKGDLIAHLMEAERLEKDGLCMVGDRAQDVIAARRNGIPTVGVLWGYGGRKELTAAGAEILIAAPTELLD
jgi:phosphoglycolate phosphatase